jgi:heme/copper-type cytochrome/quinol oxidase subunit 2
MAFVLFIAIIFIVLSIAVIVIWYIRKRRGKNPKKQSAGVTIDGIRVYIADKKQKGNENHDTGLQNNY